MAFSSVWRVLIYLARMMEPCSDSRYCIDTCKMGPLIKNSPYEDTPIVADIHIHVIFTYSVMYYSKTVLRHAARMKQLWFLIVSILRVHCS